MPVSSEAIPDIPLQVMDLPADLEQDNPLWQFALTFWQDCLAQKTCLSLQKQGWSVTRILCAGWLALNGRSYTGIEDTTVTEWRSRVTGRLRALRKSIPKAQPPYHDIRTGSANLEIAAERIELALSWRTLTSLSPDKSTMHECRKLIENNLTAAAPASGITADTWQQLSTLGDIFNAFQKGDTQL